MRLCLPRADPDLMGPNVAPPSTAPSAPVSHHSGGAKQLKSPRAAPLGSGRGSAPMGNAMAAAGAASLSPPQPQHGSGSRKPSGAHNNMGFSPPSAVKQQQQSQPQHTKEGFVQPMSARVPANLLHPPAFDALDHGVMQMQDRTVAELRETVDVLQLKVSKLEQLLKLKDSKIETLQGRLAKLTVEPSKK